MYSIIIVDDQRSVVDKMIKYVNWNELGVKVEGTACNGRDGYDKIMQLRPDIVMTDISMPVWDGLEMIRQLKKSGLSPKFVILTGYEDFEYAKVAVKYGVFDYIVKPALPKNIYDAMKKVVSLCAKEAEQKAYEERIKKQLEESMPIVQQMFIEDLLENNVSTVQEFDERCEFLGLDFESPFFTVAVIQIDDMPAFKLKYDEKGRQRALLTLSSVLQSTLKLKSMYSNFRGRNIRVLLNDARLESESFQDVFLLGIIKRYVEKIKKSYGISISVGLGGTADSALSIGRSCHQAMESLKYKMLLGKGKVICYRDIVHSETVSRVIQYYDRNQLIDGLKMRKPEAVKGCLDELFSNIRVSGLMQKEYIKAILMEMFATVMYTLYEIGEKVPQEIAEEKNVLIEIEQRDTLDDIESYIRCLFDILFEGMGNKRMQRSLRVVEQMEEYIKKNYMNDISLTELSRHIFLTPNYLSIIFTKYTKKTFNDYLCELRINKSKELLSSGKYMVYEVCEMVGYKNLDYFRKLFKKYTGHSPSDYSK